QTGRSGRRSLETEVAIWTAQNGLLVILHHERAGGTTDGMIAVVQDQTCEAGRLRKVSLDPVNNKSHRGLWVTVKIGLNDILPRVGSQENFHRRMTGDAGRNSNGIRPVWRRSSDWLGRKVHWCYSHLSTALNDFECDRDLTHAIA